MENSMLISQKVKQEFSYDPIISSLGVYTRKVKRYAHKNLHMGVHNCIIINNQKVEITQIFISWWMARQM